MWQVGTRHSKSWRFADVNYAAASDEDRESIFRSYQSVLNALPTDAAAKITIFNRRMNHADFERTVLMKPHGDALDRYRTEYNRILTDQVGAGNNLVQEKYVTISIPQRKIEESRAYFRRVDANLTQSFGRLDSGAWEISMQERLRLLHDFFRPGEEELFSYEQASVLRRGMDFRDLICPDGLRFRDSYFEMGDKFGRVLFLKDFGSYLRDDMIADLSAISRSLVLSIDILPIPTDEAVREVQSRILGIETDITRWQQRQNDKNNFSASVPYELEQLRAEAKEYLDDLTVRDQRMMFAVVTLVHIADTLEQLNADTETLRTIGREHSCHFATLYYQQEDGLNTVLPYGLRRIKALRTLTTESTAVLMPFRAQEIQDAGGICYGVNAVSKNLLICNRKRLISAHAFYLGVSGSGKSVSMMNTVLPYGLRRIKALRTLTTESTAVLMPFRAQEIQDAGGICYGVNAVSKNLLICNRKRLISPHAFYLGVSGSGKSVGMKNTVASIALSTNDDIIIIDAEREYGDLVRALGGEIIEISPSSPHHINPLELGEGYDADENPIAVKAEVITSILEQQMGAGTLTGSHKSIIDRCTANVYRPYLKSRGKRPAPLLTDWRNEVMRQVDPEAREIALAAELITEGSLNVFAHAGNVNMDSRIIALDLYEMGEQLRPTALVVTLEAIQNRVAANRKRGKFTWVFIDECYLYFKYKYSADVLYRAWKRWRKYGAPLTAATQNVEECLKSETARLMLANSEFLLLFNQAATDRAELGKLLRLSDTQMGYVTNVEAGHGLLRMGGALVPFVNTIPKDTELYRLMTTTPNEKF